MDIKSKAVVRLTDPVSKVGPNDIASLQLLASKAELRRSRICFHANDMAELHEMHICLCNNSYIRPAKHLHKVESLTVIDGLAKLFLFHDKGDVEEIVELGPYSSGRKHYYRLNYPVFHTLLIETETFLFHEVTEGPFDLYETESAKWSPAPSSIPDTIQFIEFLKKAQVGECFNG